MALDGISINQLRILDNSDSGEFNSKLLASGEVKTVDKLSDGQKVDPDKEKEHESQFFDDEEEYNQEQKENESEEAEIVKFDLSNGDRYILKIDEDDSVLIFDKTINSVVQKIDASELSNLVNYLSFSQGCIVNRKF